MDKYFDKLKNLTEKINETVEKKLGATLQHNQYPSIKAYVTFEHQE